MHEGGVNQGKEEVRSRDSKMKIISLTNWALPH